MKLQGNVAIITGSTRGIGHAVAMAFVREGASVVINGTRPQVVEETVRAIRAAGGKAAGWAGEIGGKDAADALVDVALREFGGLHILVNNAAISVSSPLGQLSEDDFDRVMRVNLRATFLNTQAAVERVLLKQQYGKIINVTSHGAFRGAPRSTPYAASKMGIIGLTLSWANELIKSKINVNCVAPAAWTDMLEAMPEKRRETLRENFRTSNVLQRVPLSDDVASTFVFLASDESAFLTGQVLQASGQPLHVL